MDQEKFMPYKPGSEISLVIRGIGAHNILKILPNSKTTAKVVRVFSPRTNSVVVLVALPSGQEAILKLFDARHSVWLRELYKLSLWTPEIETKVITFLTTPQPKDAYEVSDGLDFFSEQVAEWNESEKEVFVACAAQEMYQTEAKAYQKLEKLQGKSVPELLADVELIGPSEEYDERLEILRVRGLLIEYIDGFQLEELLQHAPKEACAGIAEQAITIINEIGDFGILNSDLHMTSVIVRRAKDQEGNSPSSADGYKVFAIDFARCKFRCPNETDEEWQKKKWEKDEEGAIGYGVEHKLRHYSLNGKPVYKYTPSRR